MPTRDSFILPIIVIGAIFTYLSQCPPVFVWTYADWIKGGAFLFGVLAAQLGLSPLKKSE